VTLEERGLPALSLHTEILRIYDRAGRVTVEGFEEEPWAALENDLLPEVRATVAAGIELLTVIMGSCDEPERPAPASHDTAEFLWEIDRLLVEEEPRDRLADLAHLGRIDLRGKSDVLEAAVESAAIWPVISAAGSCLRTLRKALAAVEHSLCEIEGLAPRIEVMGERERSLAVRRAYAKFRAAIRGLQERPAIQEILTGAATSIAMLIGRDVYRDFRIGDRVRLRELQHRLLHWQRTRQDEASGRQLWTDILGFSELIGEVRRRQELAEHDREILTAIRRRLQVSSDSTLDGMRSALMPLLGWNDQIDDWLLRQAPLDLDTLRKLLRVEEVSLA